MTTLHRPPTPLDIICEAQELHLGAPMTWAEAERRAAVAKAAVIANLKAEIEGAFALAAYHTANGRLDIAANFSARADEYRAELAEVEGR